MPSLQSAEGGTLIKTIRQYSRGTLPQEELEKLMEIAADYRAVKQYVYDRYGGVRSFEKLYPGYTIQNEMTRCDLRSRLGLPSVYFYLAIQEALADIKTEWARVQKQIQKRIRENENFTPEERHYLRYCLKMSPCYSAILNHRDFQIPEVFLSAGPPLEFHRLDNYLRRQTRRYLQGLKASQSQGFRISGKAYRYENGGIFIATKEKRKRIFVPLTDKNKYEKQLYILLFPENRKMEIRVPLEVRVNALPPDYQNEIGLSWGYHTMLTSSSKKSYGDELGRYEMEEASRVREALHRRQKIRYVQSHPETESKKAENIDKNNLGLKKYRTRRKKYISFVYTYINREINRLLEEEKPSVIYLPKLPAACQTGWKKESNNYLSMWRRGYIRERLMYKCRERSIRVVEVPGKDISVFCSACGGKGKKDEQQFICSVCGICLEERVNAARNALKRGQE